MRRSLPAVVVAMCVGCHPAPAIFTTGGDDVPAERGSTYRWSFDETLNAAAPRRTFVGVLGRWRVVRDPHAASPPNVLRQEKRYDRDAWPRVVVADLAFAAATVRVRCRPDAGDAACGLMLGFTDSDSYVAVHAAGGTLRVERVASGARREIAAAPVPFATGEWHVLEARVRGGIVHASCDGGALLEADTGGLVSGKIGLVARGGAEVAFDDLEATAEGDDGRGASALPP